MASDAAKCWNPVRKKLCKIPRKARREFEAERAVLPRERVINRPVVAKLWVNGCASEDRDDGQKRSEPIVNAHCERCHDDKAAAPEVQPEGTRRQRTSVDRRVALQGRRVTINTSSSHC